MSNHAKDWDSKHLDIVYAYNICFKKATNSTPYFFAYGKECNVPLELEIPSLKLALMNLIGERELIEQRLTILAQLNEQKAWAYTNALATNTLQKKYHNSNIKPYKFWKDIQSYSMMHDMKSSR